MYDKNSSFRTVGEAFGVNKDQIQKLVKRKAEVLEEYSGNEPSHSRCIRRKTDNDEINELTWRWFQDATTRRVQVSGPLIQSDSSDDDEIPLSVLRLSKDLFGCDYEKLPGIDNHVQTSADWDLPARGRVRAMYS